MQFFKKLSLITFLFSAVVFAQPQNDPPKTEHEKNVEALDKSMKNQEQFITKENADWVKTIDKKPTAKNKKMALNVINSVKKENIAKTLKNKPGETNLTLKEIENTNKVISPSFNAKQKEQRYGDIDGYIMVSLSMPKISLERLFIEAVHQHPNKNFVFLFRGWNAPHLTKFMNEVTATVKEVENAPSIAIDPTVFRALKVKEVPFFALKTKSNEWKKVLGDVSISQAIAESENHYNNSKPIGRTYLIKEQDILNYIENKLKNYDWNKELKTAKSDLMKDRFKGDLPTAIQTKTYYVDPTTTIKKAIMFKGDVVVAPGTSVNPLEYMPLTKKYIFINATDKRQVEIAMKWKRQSKKPVVVLTSKIPKSTKIQKLMVDNFEKINEIDPLVKRRFGITHVPSIVSQKGLVLEVTMEQVVNSEIFEEER